MTARYSTSQPDFLTCVQLDLAEAQAHWQDLVESVIWEQGVSGVERQDDETWSALVEDPDPRPQGALRWRIHVTPDGEPERIASAIRDQLSEVEGLRVSTSRLDDLSFLTRWKDFFCPAQVSPRLIVHPPWDIPSVGPEVARVQIEPGMAFGTGTHETTRLCMAWLDRRLAARPAPCAVADIGCGSGILAIAADKLGARPVYGIDVDQEAVRIAIANAELNETSPHVVFSSAPASELHGHFDLVVANILPFVLRDLADDLWRLVAVGGELLLSGILLSEADDLRAHFDRAGARFVSQEDAGEWCSLSWKRDAAPEAEHA